jgi:FtsZ-binding cell division protein ZapB
MTDGNTGFHVAPITEDDMNRVTSILKRAMDTMIGASQLADDVDMLRQTVSGLQADVDRLRNQNNALDEALNHSRQVRDEQTRKIDELRNDNVMLNNHKDELQIENDKLTLANEQYQIENDKLTLANDDAEFKNLELEDKLAAAEAKLAKVAELHRAIFPEPVKAEPVSEPAPVDPVPAPAPEPEPVQPDTRDTWEPGYYWDHNTSKYWRNGLTPKPDGEHIPF